MSSSSHLSSAHMALTNLPPEIHHEIIKRLPFYDKSNLRATNPYFHTVIPPFTHQDLLAAEREDYSIERNLYTCRDCQRLRHKSKFADDTTKKKKSRDGNVMRIVMGMSLRLRGMTTTFSFSRYTVLGYITRGDYNLL